MSKSIILQKKLVAVARKASLVTEVSTGIIKGLFCLFSCLCICSESDLLGMFYSPCTTVLHIRLHVVSIL